jgi:hypothetical protein
VGVIPKPIIKKEKHENSSETVMNENEDHPLLDRRDGLKALAKILYINTKIWGEILYNKINENLNKRKTLVIYENNENNKKNEKNKNENEKMKIENKKIEGELYMGEITISNNDGFFHIAYDDGEIYIYMYVYIYRSVFVYLYR